MDSEELFIEYFDGFEKEEKRGELLYSPDRQKSAAFEMQLRAWCLAQRVMFEQLKGNEIELTEAIHLFPMPLDRRCPWGRLMPETGVYFAPLMGIWFEHMKKLVNYMDTLNEKYTFFFALLNSYQEFLYWQDKNMGDSFFKANAEEINKNYLETIREIGAEIICKEEVRRRVLEEGDKKYSEFIDNTLRLIGLDI